MDLTRTETLLPQILAALYAVAAVIWFGAHMLEGESFASIFFTPDQRGQWAMHRGDFGSAAERFEDPLRKATAWYQSGNFKAAIREARSLDLENEQALFLLGNALAHRQSYTQATAAYDRLLDRNPEHPAKRNRDLVRRIFENLPRTDGGGREVPVEAALGPELEKSLEETPNPDELFRGIDAATAWLRQAEPDPAQFLRAKFLLQMEKNNAEGSRR